MGSDEAPEDDPMPPLWVGDQPNPEYVAWYQRNKPPALGPSSDFGWQTCHGCEVDSDMWGHPSQKHADDCPGVCIRPDCNFHNSRPSLNLRERFEAEGRSYVTADAQGRVWEHRLQEAPAHNDDSVKPMREEFDEALTLLRRVPDLIDPRFEGKRTLTEIEAFLDKHRGFLA